VGRDPGDAYLVIICPGAHRVGNGILLLSWVVEGTNKMEDICVGLAEQLRDVGRDHSSHFHPFLTR